MSETPIQRAAREGYLHRCAVALDQFANVALWRGFVGETISAHAAREAPHGNKAAIVLLWVLDKIQKNHGRLAEEADLGRAEIVERIETEAL